MIISDLSKFKAKTKLNTSKWIREWNGIKINIGSRKSLIRCDCCNKEFKGFLGTYFDRKKHICFGCQVKIFNKGKKRSLESRIKMSKKKKGKKRYFSLKHKQNLSKALTGIKRSKETKRKLSKAFKGRSNYKLIGRKFSKEHKQKLSKAQLKLYKNGFYENKKYSKISQELFWKIYKIIKNDFKKIYFATLDNCKRNYFKNFEYRLNTKKHTRFLDFYIKDIELIIEYLGTYYHKNDYIDLKRELEIKEVKPNTEILYVDDIFYKQSKYNKKIVLNYCLDKIYERI